jgi:hypothetical protein
VLHTSVVTRCGWQQWETPESFFAAEHHRAGGHSHSPLITDQEDQVNGRGKIYHFQRSALFVFSAVLARVMFGEGTVRHVMTVQGRGFSAAGADVPVRGAGSRDMPSDLIL